MEKQRREKILQAVLECSFSNYQASTNWQAEEDPFALSETRQTRNGIPKTA
jgi:hypothetical protein